MEDLEKTMSSKVEEFLSSPELLKKAAPLLKDALKNDWDDFVITVEKTVKAKGKEIAAGAKDLLKSKMSKYLGKVKDFLKKLGDADLDDIINGIKVVREVVAEYQAAEKQAREAEKDTKRISVTKRAWDFSKVIHTLLGYILGLLSTLAVIYYIGR